MGNRSHLTTYLREDTFKEGERKYYNAYKNTCRTNTKEDYDKLISIFNEVKDVWDSDAYNMFPINASFDLPSIDYLEVDGITYFTAAYGFSKMSSISWEYKNSVPDYFLILFDISEYKDRHERNGHIYNNNRFYTTVEKAIARLKKSNIFSDMEIQLLGELSKLPNDAILELDFSEVIQCEYNPNYRTLEYYLERVKELAI